MAELLGSPVFTWVILPLLIFFARILDVSLGTIRIIFVSKGKRFLAPLLGFFEVLIWLLAIGQVMQHLTNVATYLAYAGGFAMGNYVGILIEEKLAVGVVVLRIITVKDADRLSQTLIAHGYGVTKVQAEGSTGPVTVIYTIIKRKNLPEVVQLIREINPKAFFSIEDARTASEGIFPAPKPDGTERSYLNRLKLRKAAK
ncbi:MAG: DUF2179 domain-containing protein [Firmicutes bacterium]|nr:DUF2179 domain-containing protein [Bacillota bacterium]